MGSFSHVTPEVNGNTVAKEEASEVTRLREYLRIKTVHPEPDYETCVMFLQKIASENDIPCKVVQVHPGRDVVIMTYEGEDPSLPTIMLNSHTDVVPVFSDMKSTGMQHFESICRLKKQGKKLKRTVHITFVPDEEIGGDLGMHLLVQHEEFKKLNVGFALDEGLASPTDSHIVFYGERTPWWVFVRCHGNPGHGSRFIENTAAEKVRRVINSFLDFRGKEEKRLKGSGCLKLGDVTTVNMTMLQGGIQFNVVPNELAVRKNRYYAFDAVADPPKYDSPLVTIKRPDFNTDVTLFRNRFQLASGIARRTLCIPGRMLGANTARNRLKEGVSNPDDQKKATFTTARHKKERLESIQS